MCRNFSTIAGMWCVGICVRAAVKFSCRWKTFVWALLNFVVDKFTIDFFLILLWVGNKLLPHQLS